MSEEQTEQQQSALEYQKQAHEERGRIAMNIAEQLEGERIDFAYPALLSVTQFLITQQTPDEAIRKNCAKNLLALAAHVADSVGLTDEELQAAVLSGVTPVNTQLPEMPSVLVN